MEVSLALGAGGARGIAHVMVLEVLDELGIKVTNCAGSSIGSVVGTMYCAGHSGAQIRDHMLFVAGRKATLLSRLFSSNAINFAGLRRSKRHKWTLLNPVRLLREFLPENMPDLLEDLQIPVITVATSLDTGQPFVFTDGPLLAAVSASIAIPGLMKPYSHDGKLLIDGGVVDPVPVRYIDQDAAPLVSVDLSMEPLHMRKIPSSSFSIGIAREAVQIMGRQLIELRHQQRPPSLHLRPDNGHLRSLDFHKMKQMMEEFQPFKENARKELARLCEIHSGRRQARCF